jgi:4-hydroxy-tetrahydrodipicolinate reductase
MTTLTISGYGKMGKMLESLAESYGFDQVVILDQREDWITKKEHIIQSQVIIDFSLPETAIENIERALEWGVPLVMGTTGWHHQLKEVEKQVEKKKGSLVYASNFSIGMNLFFQLNTFLANLMREQRSYALSLEEIHHTQKLDSPSGTAISIADQLIETLPTKDSWVNEATEKENEVPIISHRIPDVPGTHKIHYTSDIDQISISHTAYNRKGFAQGALLAAKWIQGKKGIHDFKDILFNKD